MKKINNFEDFKTAVKNFITEELPECSVDLVNVPKNNSVCLSGIVVRQKNANVSPTIYLESCYARLQSGESFSEILLEIMDEATKRMEVPENVNIKVISDFALAKDKICYRLINKSANSELLKTIPHRDFHDLAIVYYIMLCTTNDSIGSIKITNDTIREWGVDEEQLYKCAHQNTPLLNKGRVMLLTDVIDGISEESSISDIGQEHITADGFDIAFSGKSEMPFYTATNVNGINGASVILYNGLLETLAQKLGSFFILPSSIHECLIISRGLEDRKEMLAMVRAVNRTEVNTEDILSNNCYFYDAQNKGLQMIS